MRTVVGWVLVGAGLVAGGAVLAREGEEREDVEEGDGGATVGAPGPMVGVNRTPTPTEGVATLYQKECGSCHLAYSPRLLPARSWVGLLAGLSSHFGDNAEITPATALALSPWLRANAGDTLGSRAATRIPREETPLRITELTWFRGEHGEIPRGWIGPGASVTSLAACASCHPGAATGRFGEGEIRIPGHGGWDD